MVGGIGTARRTRLAIALCATPMLFLGAACSNDDGDPIMNVGTDAVGSCLQFDDSVGAEVTELPTVPCEEPHSHEIFAVVVSTESVYPGFEALETTAQALCLAEFEDFVGVNAFDSVFFYSWMVPTLNSWDREDDREIICVLGSGDGEPLTGTMRDSNR